MSEEHRFTATVTWDATERSGSLEAGSGRFATTFGGAPSLGGRSDRTNPEELLLAALATCFVQTWAIFLAKLRVPVAEPRVDGALELGADPAGGYRVTGFELVARVLDAFDARSGGRGLVALGLATLFSARAWTAPRSWNPDGLPDTEK